MRGEEDEAWRAIVDNYGERAVLDPAEEYADAADALDDPFDELEQLVGDDDPDPAGFEDPLEDRLDNPVLDVPVRDVPARPEPEEEPEELIESDEAFVPPDPPPFLLPPPDRTLAWVGVFGAPLVLLITILARIHLEPLIGWCLVAAFLGGFGYLLVNWPEDPRDPWDDGAEV